MPSESTHPVNAAFFGLAFIAELKLKLLGARRPSSHVAGLTGFEPTRGCPLV